jgi:iron complex transport system ATP-binding protein
MIHFAHATVRRREKLLLNDISIDIGTEEHAAVIGQNGSGKSTLVSLISRDIHPLQVPELEMTLFGKNRWNIFELKSRLGIVSDHLQELCRSTYKVEDIILSGFFSSIGIERNHQVTPEMQTKAFETAEFMGVKELLQKQMNRLSSGETRRILIARALVNEPDTLILDEPTNSLDLKAQFSFKKTLRKIAKSGKNIILVTHDLSDIIPEIQRVIVLKQGRIFAAGKKNAVLNEELLSEAYDTRVFVDHRDGWYKAWC